MYIFSIFAEPTTTTEVDECEKDDDCKDNAEKTECKEEKCTSNYLFSLTFGMSNAAKLFTNL